MALLSTAMAKRKSGQTVAVPVKARLRKHIRDLGLAGPEAYAEWCAARGFQRTLDKTELDLAREIERSKAEIARKAAQARLHHNPRRLIEAACAGDIGAGEVTRPQLHQVCRAIERSRTGGGARPALARLLLKVHADGGFVFETASIASDDYPYIHALVKINDRRGQWVRSLEDWRPTSHNARRRFASLVRHLFTHYPVPAFMDQAWFRTGRDSHRLRDWFIHIGSGKNLRTAVTPVPLTNRIVHHFLEAPSSYSIEGAIRWGQIHALGGDQRLVGAIMSTRIGEELVNDDFWSSVFRFFVANPMLDRRHVGPIVDFLFHHKFETREVVTGGGQRQQLLPPQPNLSMRGRTAESLLGQVDAWHRALGKKAGADGVRFAPSGFSGLEMKKGREGRERWRIRELLSGFELQQEGSIMRHCVASYAHSCLAGRCSIWTMEHETPAGVEKRQTIEVLKDGLIVQCRGKLNRHPVPTEYDILAAWARDAGLRISQYIRTSG